jgi:hypothetical protein
MKGFELCLFFSTRFTTNTDKVRVFGFSETIFQVLLVSQDNLDNFSLMQIMH